MGMMMKKKLLGEKAIMSATVVPNYPFAAASVAIRFISFLLLSSTFLLLLPVSSNEEGDALYALRTNWTDSDGVLLSWSPSLPDPCTWSHVTCDSANTVTRVDLGASNLAGQLLPQLANLKNLQYLTLYQNKLSGSIPHELVKLQTNPNLKYLDLSGNCLDLTDNPFDPSNAKVDLRDNHPANCA